MTPNTTNIPEYEGILREQRINTIEDHLKKCYSSERYQEFQDAVETILLKALERESTQSKLSNWVKNEVKQELSTRWWRNFSFWIPTLIAAAAVIVALLKEK